MANYQHYVRGSSYHSIPIPVAEARHTIVQWQFCYRLGRDGPRPRKIGDSGMLATVIETYADEAEACAVAEMLALENTDLTTFYAVSCNFDERSLVDKIRPRGEFFGLHGHGDTMQMYFGPWDRRPPIERVLTAMAKQGNCLIVDYGKAVVGPEWGA